MSKSYKHEPCYKDHVKGSKRLANRRVRRTKDVLNKGDYKKIYEQYNISDYKFYTPWSEYLQNANNRMQYREGRELTIEEELELHNEYDKYYKRK